MTNTWFAMARWCRFLQASHQREILQHQRPDSAEDLRFAIASELTVSGIPTKLDV